MKRCDNCKKRKRAPGLQWCGRCLWKHCADNHETYVGPVLDSHKLGFRESLTIKAQGVMDAEYSDEYAEVWSFALHLRKATGKKWYPATLGDTGTGILIPRVLTKDSMKVFQWLTDLAHTLERSDR